MGGRLAGLLERAPVAVAAAAAALAARVLRRGDAAPPPWPDALRLELPPAAHSQARPVGRDVPDARRPAGRVRRGEGPAMESWCQGRGLPACAAGVPSSAHAGPRRAAQPIQSRCVFAATAGDGGGPPWEDAAFSPSSVLDWPLQPSGSGLLRCASGDAAALQALRERLSSEGRQARRAGNTRCLSLSTASNTLNSSNTQTALRGLARRDA
jgi:hypothetical protein